MGFSIKENWSDIYWEELFRGIRSKLPFFDRLSFIDAYEISTWKFWSRDLNLDNTYPHKVFQFMESSRIRCLDLKFAVAKGLTGFHEFWWEKYSIFIFNKFQVKCSGLFFFQLWTQTINNSHIHSISNTLSEIKITDIFISHYNFYRYFVISFVPITTWTL